MMVKKANSAYSYLCVNIRDIYVRSFSGKAQALLYTITDTKPLKAFNNLMAPHVRQVVVVVVVVIKFARSMG